MMWNQDLYQKTILFATKVHGRQKVPGSELPYLLHLSNVCAETLAAMMTENNPNYDINFAMQCALLHDTIEDTPITFEDIEMHFGKKVAIAVLALTKNEKLPKAERMKASLRRIKVHSDEARIVKMADRITNLQKPPKHWDKEKKRKYWEEAKIILEELRGVNEAIEERLRKKIERYKQWL